MHKNQCYRHATRTRKIHLAVPEKLGSCSICCNAAVTRAMMMKVEAASKPPPSQQQRNSGPHEPQPSLFDVVRFLVDDFVLRLPRERCPLCEGKILPEMPPPAAAAAAASAKQPLALPGGAPKGLGGASSSSVGAAEPPSTPVRVYCGHWYHLGCLDP